MYREDYKMVESACGLGCLFLGWFFGVFVPFSTICLSSLPSTMTWAPCPHGVRTRGKKNKQSRKKASKGPHFTKMSDQRPHSSAAKSWSRCRSGVSQCSNVDCIPGKWGGVAVRHAVEKTFLVAQPVQPVALTSPVACFQSAINKWRP